MAVDLRHAQRGAFGSESSAAAARLFEQYEERIHAFCRHILRHPSDAEDAVQTTFLYAHRALCGGVRPENEYAWLHTIAKNVCRSQFRSASRHPSVAGVDFDALPGPDRSENGRRELLAVLPSALAALPENQRSALVMREWQGLGHDEIATRLELTPTATSALLTRARRSLAAALTAAGRPRAALEVSLLMGTLRTNLRALLGSAASKTAVGAAVASVAVGGMVVERTLDRGSPPAAPPAPRAIESRAPAVIPSATAVTGAPDRGTVAAPRLRPSASTATAVRLPSKPVDGTSRAAVPPRSFDAAVPTQSASESAPATPRREGDASRSAPPQVPDPGLAVPILAVELPPVPLPPLPPVPPLPAPDATSGLPVDVPPVPPLPTLP